MDKKISNKSKTYLLPLLSEFIPLEEKYIGFITNVYIFDDVDKHKECIYILHDFSFKHPEFTAYEHRLTSSDLFVDLYDIGNQVLYVFKFPEEYLHEYESFIKGKYSKYGIDTKEKILDFYTEMLSGNIAGTAFLLKVKQVLFKDRKLKEQIEKELSSTRAPIILDDDAELSSIIDIGDETFELSKYLE